MKAHSIQGVLFRLFIFFAAVGCWQPAFSSERRLRTLFSLDFEDGMTADSTKGKLNPTNDNLPRLVDGVTGKAARFQDGSALRYVSEGILDTKKGAFSIWLRPSADFLSSGWKYIFSGDSPEGPGEKPLCLWSVGERGLRYDVRDRPKMDSLRRILECHNWRPHQWHHVVCSWDDRGSISLFVDGLPAGGWGGDSKKCFLPVPPFSIPEQEAFILGAFRPDGQLNWRGDIDSFRLFDRPLTLREVHTEYGKCMAAPTRIVDRFFFAGEKETCRIEFTNWKGRTVFVSPKVSLQDKNGREISRQSLPSVRIRPDDTHRAEIDITIPAPGEHVLEISPGSGGGKRLSRHAIMALPRTEGPQGTGERILIREMDVAETQPIAESARSSVVNSALGRCREAGVHRYDRFAIGFEVEEINAPHIAVFSIPDDKIRTMEVLYQPLSRQSDYQGQSGIFTGGEYPLSGGMIEHSITFWPLARRNAFVFMTAEKDAPAAVGKIRIYRLPQGFSRLAIKPFSGSVPARSIGMYYEDPVIPSGYGRAEDCANMQSFPGFGVAVDRMLDYMQSFGQDLLRYPVAWYGGPLYGLSKAEPRAMASRPHPQDFPAYLLKRLGARGMKFNGWLHVHQLASLNPYCLLDEERVLAGEETVTNMRYDNHLFYTGWHHKDPAYNPLDPRVQQAVKRLVAEILDRYGEEPALEGLTLNVVECSLFAFGSAKSGYNDVNLRRFQQDTGITIPVGGKDRKRFSKSWKWLMEHAKEEWIAWRCRRIHDYYKELAGMLRGKRSDLKLGVSLYQYPVNYVGDKQASDYLDPNRHPVEWYREQGVDPALFAEDDDIVLVRHIDMRLRHNRARRGNLPNIESLRMTSLSPEIAQPFNRLAAVQLNIHDVYWESSIGRSKPLELPYGAREHGWRVSQLNANTFHALEQYAASMNNFDPLSIAKGGFVVGLNGMEPYLARFARAYRALPAQKFDDVPGLSDPVRVRQKVVDGKNYFYVLNRLPYPVAIEIRLGGDAIVTDIADGEPAGRRVVNLSLRPYDLRSFKTHARTVVAGGKARVPEHLIAGMKESIADANAGIRRLTADADDTKELMQYLAMAEDCFASGRYARLYFLLQESWLATVTKFSDTAK